MPGLSENIKAVRERIESACARTGRSPGEISLVAVSKTMGADRVQEAVDAGLRLFGENRVQDAAPKIRELSGDITWHMVGHLQRNKVKTALDIFDIIHSVDSSRLAQALSSSASRPVPVLLQVNVSSEVTKSGFRPDEIADVLADSSHLPNLMIEGLMTIAPLASDPEEVRPVFRKLREMRDASGLKHLSMGMTDDFEVAIEEGATMVRIGRAIFGG